MHIPSISPPKHRSQSTITSTTTISVQSQEHVGAKPAHRQRFKIKNKRNIKIGVTALRKVSKWTDKATLTLEKLEVQDTTSANHRERQVRLNVVRRTLREHDQHGFRETAVFSPPSTKEEVAKSEFGVVREVQVQAIKESRAAEMSSSEDAKTDGTQPITNVVCQVHEAVVVAETESGDRDEELRPHAEREDTDSESESADTSDEENERDDVSSEDEHGYHDEDSSSEEEDSADDDVDLDGDSEGENSIAKPELSSSH